MKKFCFDTSGLSNPHEKMPEDIHESMWAMVCGMIAAGDFAVNAEIYNEMQSIPGNLGNCIDSNKASMILEVGDDAWNYAAYVGQNSAMLESHHDFIREYCGGGAKTVCVNDISIIALAKSLGLPLVSMENSAGDSPSKRQIPDVCNMEHVEHLTFNDFLRRSGRKF